MDYPVTEAVEKFLNTGHADWDTLFESLPRDIRHDVSRCLDLMAQNAVKASAYLEARGIAGQGDHGHDDALETARKEVKKVRKAMGYALP